MPNIRAYDAGDIGLRPTETGVESRAATARRVGAFYNQLAGATEGLARETRRLGGEFEALGSFKGHLEAATGARIGSTIKVAGDAAVDYLSHREISQGAAEFARLNSDLTDQWNEAVKQADPNDPSLAGRFREETLNPALEKFQQAFTTEKGQNWALSHTTSLRMHMDQRTTADMATMAGHAVTVNMRQMANSWSNTARNDPSAVDYLLRTVDSSVGGVIDSSPNLKGAAAAKVRMEVTQKAKEDIVKAGALGAIEKSGDPEKAAAIFAERYPDYVNAQEID